MNIFFIAKKLIKVQLRSPETFFIYLAFPVVLIAILGTAFSGSFGGVTIEGDVLYHVKGKGHLSQVLVENFQHLEDFNFTEVEDVNGALAKVERNKKDGLLIIDSSKNSIDIKFSEYSDYTKAVLKTFLDAVLAKYNLISYITQTGGEYSSVSDENFVEVKSFIKDKSPGAMDYYGITILTMIIMYGAYISSYGIIEEKNKGTFNRILITPVKSHQLFLGVSLGSIVQILIQSLLVIIIAGKFLGVDYGDRYIEFYSILLSLIFMVVSFGILLSTVIKDSGVTNNLINVVAQVSVFIGGGYFVLPETGLFNLITKLSPIYWVNKGLMESVNFDSSNFVGPGIIIPLAIGALSLIGTTIKLRRSEA